MTHSRPLDPRRCRPRLVSAALRGPRPGGPPDFTLPEDTDNSGLGGGADRLATAHQLGSAGRCAPMWRSVRSTHRTPLWVRLTHRTPLWVRSTQPTPHWGAWDTRNQPRRDARHLLGIAARTVRSGGGRPQPV